MLGGSAAMLALLLQLSGLLLFPQATRPPVGEVHRAIPGDNHTTLDLAWADFDGDGNVDLLFATDGPEALRLGEGTGAFRSAPFPASNSDTRSLGLGDFDGDGHLDVFSSNDGPNALSLGDGAGAFEDASGNLPSEAAPSRAATVGDVDRDGDLDLLVGRFQDRVVQLENDGAGVFTDAAARMPATSHDVRNAVLVDFDGDGAPEYAAATGSFLGLEPNVFFLNDGSGVYTDESARLGGRPDETVRVFTDDYDLDGNQDLLFAVIRHAPTSHADVLLLGDGQAGFVPAPGLLPSILTYDSVILSGDLDVDGDADLILSNERMYLNDGTGDMNTLAPGEFDTPSQFELNLVDVDGDADPDAVVTFLRGDEVMLNDGSPHFERILAGFEETFPPKFSSGDTSRAAVGDVDGDGDLDVALSLVISFSGDSLQLYTNDGFGAFTDVSSTSLPLVFNDGYAVELVDVDGDADLDLVHGNAHGNDLFLNDGTGSFQSAPFGQLPYQGFVFEFEAADFDGDGDVDLFGSQGIAFPGQNLLYDNDGSGQFTDVSRRILDNPFHESLEAEALDFDLDGDLDLLVGNWRVSMPEQLLINQDGFFEDGAALLPAGDHPTNSVAAGDFDGDGDLDVVLGTGFVNVSGEMQKAPEVLWRNEGGRFVDDSGLLPSASYCFAVRPGDVDADGNLDLFVADLYTFFYPTKSRLFLGDGTGAFTNSAWLATSVSIPSVSDAILEDFDGDGDLDLFVADQFDPRLFQGLARQVARRAPASIGKRLDVDVVGPPSGPWSLFAASATARFELDLGRLHLDPTSLLGPPHSGVLDASGRVTPSFFLPADPNLVGIEVFLQAVVGNPARLTNLEPVPVHGF